MGKRLRTPLIAAHVAALVVVALTIATTVLGLGFAIDVNDRADVIVGDLATADQLTTDARRLVTAGRRYMLTGDPRDKTRARELEQQLAGTRDRVVTQSDAGELGRAVDRLVSVVARSMTERQTLADQELVAELVRFDAEVAPVQTALTASARRIVETERGTLADSRDSARSFALRARWVVVLLGTLALVLGAMASAFVLREVARRGWETRVATELARRMTASRQELIGAADDLRRPLRSIAERAEALQRTLHDPEELKGIRSIAAAGVYVDERLAVLLDVSRLQNGVAALRNDHCRVDHIIERAVASQQRRADERAIRLRSESAIATVYADANRLGQVLSFLLDGALEHARIGAEIVVSATACEGAVRFAVSAGAGGLPESLSRILNSPASGEPSHDKLDLYLCRRLVEAHGGRMGVDATGPRATCWFVVPTEPRLLK